MPRATPLSRMEVERRATKPLVDPALTEKLVEIAGAASKDTKEKLRYKLDCTVSAFLARRLGDKQESPARILAAFKPGLKPAKKLLTWLDTLPVGMLVELQAGGLKEHLRGLEEHLSRIMKQVDYWQRHVKAHRPTGEGAAGLALRQSLKNIYNEHCLSLRRHKNPKERKQHLDDLVARASKMIGAKYPNERKHRRRFSGEQKHPSKRGPKLYQRPLRKSADERRLERELKHFPI
jgi:hypothetical protein